MTAATMERPGSDAHVLDLRTTADCGPATMNPVPLLPTQPDVWVEWRCAACEALYPEPLGRCPHCGDALAAVLLSQPFLWLG